MEMKKAERLKVVLDLEMVKKDKAAKALAEAISNLDNAKNSLRQLSDYLDDYQSQAIEVGKVGVNAAAFRNRQSLAGRIGGAIEQQGHSIDLFERQLEQVRKHYEKVYARVRSIEILIEKSEAQELRKQAIQEQKMLDEFTQAQQFRKNI
ncbi:flagellar export protein FliJ [Litoribacillus peritrichatus]|uniref:Flagellar FliJ protein n=2 Tax=Litoribacillus peritrichatus TaxID=718191 RepID=A0ABP7M3Q4_9GAMM